MAQIAPEKLQQIIEAALMVSGRPMTIASLQKLFSENECPSNAEVKEALAAIKERYQDHGIELYEVATGYRIQAKADLSPWLSRLWEERAPRYSRAFLETLSLIAYKQPITRAEIEEIRGVTVNSQIIKTLLEREWIRVIGFRDVPGKPAILGTTKTFLDYFNLKSLTDLPTLAEFKSLQDQEAQLQVQLALEESNVGPSNSDAIPDERVAIISENDNIILATPEESADAERALFEEDDLEEGLATG